MMKYTCDDLVQPSVDYISIEKGPQLALDYARFFGRKYHLVILIDIPYEAVAHADCEPVGLLFTLSRWRDLL